MPMTTLFDCLEDAEALGLAKVVPLGVEAPIDLFGVLVAIAELKEVVVLNLEPPTV